MSVLLWLCLAAGAVAAAKVASQDPRRAILAALVVMSFVPEAIPPQGASVSGLLTAITMALVVAALAMSARTRRLVGALGRRSLLLLAALGALILLFAVDASNEAYALEKAGAFFLRVVIPAVGLAALAPYDERDVRVGVTALAWGALAASLNLIAFGDLAIGRATLEGENPITYARAIGIGASALTGWAAAALIRGSVRTIVFTLLPLPIMLLAIAATGSRGPFVAVGSSTLVVAIAWGIRSKRPLRAVAGFAVLILAMTATWNAVRFGESDLAGIQRIEAYLGTVGENSSDVVRLNDWSMAWAGILDAGGMGIGTGGFAGLVNRSGRVYPHDVFLEVLLEQGILALGLVILLLVIAVARALRLAGRPMLAAAGVAAMFFFALANALVSGDVPANFQLWLSIVLLTGIPVGERSPPIIVPDTVGASR